MVTVIRHGPRADHVDRRGFAAHLLRTPSDGASDKASDGARSLPLYTQLKDPLPLDFPLDPDLFEPRMCIETGRIWALRRFSEAPVEGVRTINIASSPFARCLQTAWLFMLGARSVEASSHCRFRLAIGETISDWTITETLSGRVKTRLLAFLRTGDLRLLCIDDNITRDKDEVFVHVLNLLRHWDMHEEAEGLQQLRESDDLLESETSDDDDASAAPEVIVTHMGRLESMLNRADHIRMVVDESERALDYACAYDLEFPLSE